MQRIKRSTAERNKIYLLPDSHLEKHAVLTEKKQYMLIICEMLIVAIAYSGSMCYQILSAKHSSEVLFLQEGRNQPSICLCGNVVIILCYSLLIITVMVSYLGKRIPQ